MNKVIMTTLTPEELKELIESAVEKGVKNYTESQNTEKEESQFLTKEEAAKYLKVSVGTLDNWNKSGILKWKKVGAMVRYRVADINEALKKK